MEQNMSSAVPAQQANAVGQLRKQTAQMSDAEYKANEMKNEAKVVTGQAASSRSVIARAV